MLTKTGESIIVGSSVFDMECDMADHHQEYIQRALHTEGGHLSIGRYGATLHYDCGCRISGLWDEEILPLALAAGLPVLDNRPMPIEDVIRVVIGGPLVAVGEPADDLSEDGCYHSLNRAPLVYVARLYKEHGGFVANVPGL
jgi:hypothetical protein